MEDAAQGIGVYYNNKHVGTFGNAGILSFYANKTITTSEGGIVLTDDDELAKNCYRLKNHGRDKKGIFKHDHIGYNFSFTEMQAAIGVSQMEKLPLILNKKKDIHDTYQKELRGIGDIKFQEFLPETTPAHWFVSFFTEKKKELAEFLLNKNIQTRDFFYPLHLQPCYQNIIKSNISFPISEKVYENGLSLPSSYGLSSEDQEYVIENIKNFFNQ